MPKSKPNKGFCAYNRMDTIELENNVKLDQLLTTNPEMEKKVRNIIRQVMKGAQGALMKSAEQYSTKQAYKAVRKAVYKKLLGGNVNILQGQGRAGQRAPLPPVRHRLETETNRKGNHRGGNRMPRSRRTEDLLTYMGADRGFILRFINSGTPNRSTNGIRNVGQIAGNNWFGPIAQRELEHAAEQFDKLLDALIAKEFK